LLLFFGLIVNFWITIAQTLVEKSSPLKSVFDKFPAIINRDYTSKVHLFLRSPKGYVD